MIEKIKNNKLQKITSRDVLALICIFFLQWSFAQNSDTKYNKPITETIKKVESIFNVKINDERKLLDGKSLDYADWRIRQGNLDVTLTQILAPFELTFFKEKEGVYIIRKFEYPRRSEDIGAERLAFLSNLYTTKEQWMQRKEEIKSCMREAFLLDKAPPTPDSKPILSKKRVHGAYSVENIALEVLPGVYATGSIYRPHPFKGKNPVIISPNGHFNQGRYRESQQIRSAMLAKMGAIVITYDLFAWGESLLQFPAETHHNSIAETIQVVEGLRLLDYVLSLSKSDTSRVGVTGGSGGGSHTMFLAALDDRIKVSVPAVMVSSHFSGGCPCESGMPVHLCGNGTNNAEISALAAPKPQLIISDGGDWTSNVPDIEFPFIKRTYGFYDAENKIENAHFPKEGHDYGLSKRMALYPFMAKHLGLDLSKLTNKNGEIEEKGYVIEDETTMKVFGDKGEKLPKNALKDIDAVYALFGEKNYKQ